MISIIFLNQKGTYIERNNKKKVKKNANIWKLNKTLLNDYRIKEKILKKRKKRPQTN